MRLPGIEQFNQCIVASLSEMPICTTLPAHAIWKHAEPVYVGMVYPAIFCFRELIAQRDPGPYVSSR